MKHFPRLGAAVFAVLLTTAACSGNSRHPIYYPGEGRPSVDRNGDGRIDSRDREGARPSKNKGNRDQVRCNNGNGNGNGNGRCRNGNRGRGNGPGE